MTDTADRSLRGYGCVDLASNDAAPTAGVNAPAEDIAPGTAA